MLVTRCAIHGRGGFFKMKDSDNEILKAYLKHIKIIEQENERLKMEVFRLSIELNKLKYEKSNVPFKSHPMMRAYV